MQYTITCLSVFLTFSVVGCDSHLPPNGVDTESGSAPMPADELEPASDVASQNHQDVILNLDPNARLGSVIRAIYQDSMGVLWVGGEGDLFKIDKQTVTSFDLKDDFGDGVTVKQIVESENAIWCGTTGGLIKIEGDTFTCYGEKDGLISRDVWSLAADKQGTLWVGTIDGVCRYDGVRFSTFEIPKSKPDPTRGVTSAEIVHCILVDSKGRVWFGTNGGAYFYEGKALTRVSRTEGLPADVVHRLVEDSENNIWIGTTHNGICRYDGETFVNYTAEGIVEGNEIWCMHKDREGDIWFSGKNMGIYRYDGDSFQRFGRDDGVDSPGMMSIFQDSDDRVWLGGIGGLFRYQDGKFVRLTERGPWK